MSTASKSPRKVAAVALEVGRRTLPEYGHRCSRKDFTLPRLFACLVLRNFFKADDRGVVAILEDNPTLCEDLGLHQAPHFTTLQKQEKRLHTDPRVRGLLTQTRAVYHDLKPGEAVEVEPAAADSTGFETDRASRYFVRRKSREPNFGQATAYRRFGKLGVAAHCDNHLILATHRGRGPRPDVDPLPALLGGFCGNAVPARLVADAGYDSQKNHELLREYLSIDSLIPPAAGRPTDKLPSGKWRFLMATGFDEEVYAHPVW